MKLVVGGRHRCADCTVIVPISELDAAVPESSCLEELMNHVVSRAELAVVESSRELVKGFLDHPFTIPHVSEVTILQVRVTLQSPHLHRGRADGHVVLLLV